MAETITIPSPSVFLRASPTPPVRSEPQPKHSRKRSLGTKKRAAAAADKTKDAAGVTKPKQSKSRNGCVTCKAKRLKCDETKPSCEQCKRRNVDCGGYKKDFKWRPFEESNTKVAVDRKRRESDVDPRPTVDKATRCLDSEVSPGQNSGQEPESRPQRGLSSAATSNSGGDGSPTASIAHQLSTPLEGIDADADPHGLDLPPCLDTDSLQDIEIAANDGHLYPPENVAALNDLNTAEMLSPSFSSLLPTTPDTVPALSSHPPALQSELSAFTNIDPELMQPCFATPRANGLQQPDVNDKDIEDIPRHSFPETSEAMAMTKHALPALRSKAAMNRTAFGAYTSLHDQPWFSRWSPELITHRFDRYTCGILSVKDGAGENPWRTLIWPMAQSSPALYHAISAMSAFHSARDYADMRIAGQEHAGASLSNLIEGINDGSMNFDTAIATTLALAFTDSWDHHTTSGNNHIKGARAMINLALSQHRQAPVTDVKLARLKFLCNTWVYMDVIARLTSTDDDETDDYDQIFSLYSNPETQHDGFGIDFGMPIDACLDPLMGCANTLFPLIGRVANLVRRVRRSPSNSPPMISQAMELKLLVETWDPPEFIEPPEDPTSNVQHSLQTAEAYRWATLLYLHQAVPEIPSPSSAEMAKKVLIFLATVPLVSRFVIVHIFPMMAAGCEVTTEEDRQWVRDRWTAMGNRLRIGPIEKCMEVTNEVWKRRDLHESRPVGRRALVSTADVHRTGLRTPAPFKRTPSFADSADPDFDDSLHQVDLRFTSRRNVMTGPSGFLQDVGQRRESRDMTGTMETDYTVRGELHWLGVMNDWGWEVLLG